MLILLSLRAQMIFITAEKREQPSAQPPSGAQAAGLMMRALEAVNKNNAKQQRK